MPSSSPTRVHEPVPLPAQAGQHDDLAKYLLMVRKKVKDPKVRRGWWCPHGLWQAATWWQAATAGDHGQCRPCRLRPAGMLANCGAHPSNHQPNPFHPACAAQVDTELVYAYAKNKDLGPLEEFITGTHLANLQAVGDRWAGTAGGAAL